jgi:hypothetical protein
MFRTSNRTITPQLLPVQWERETQSRYRQATEPIISPAWRKQMIVVTDAPSTMATIKGTDVSRAVEIQEQQRNNNFEIKTQQ